MINRMYQLYELRDEIKTGIENLEKLLPVQQDFINVVKSSEKYESFKFMLTDWEEYHNALPIKIDNMKFRLSIINELITDYEKRDYNSDIIMQTVSKVLECIGAITPASTETPNTEKDLAN